MMHVCRRFAKSETGAVHDKSGWCFVEESVSSVINEPPEDTSPEVHDEGAHAGHGDHRSRTRGRVHDGLG